LGLWGVCRRMKGFGMAACELNGLQCVVR